VSWWRLFPNPNPKPKTPKPSLQAVRDVGERLSLNRKGRQIRKPQLHTPHPTPLTPKAEKFVRLCGGGVGSMTLSKNKLKTAMKLRKGLPLTPQDVAAMQGVGAPLAVLGCVLPLVS
jgi:hypothetical protein